MVKKLRNTAILAFIATAIYVLVPDDFMPNAYWDDAFLIIYTLFTVNKYQRMKAIESKEQEDECLL